MDIGTYYSTCNELPLWNFIRCLTGDVTHLIKLGWPTKKSLEKAWENIFNEYIGLSKEVTHKAMLGLLKQISSMNGRFVLVYEVVRSLRINYNEELVKFLLENGYKYKFDHLDYEGFNKDLDRVMAKAKGLTLQAKDRQKELDSLKGKSEGETDWDELCSALGKFQGYQIDKKKITVSEFVSILNSYKAEAERGRKN